MGGRYQYESLTIQIITNNKLRRMATDFSRFEKSIIGQFQRRFGDVKIKYNPSVNDSPSTHFILKPLPVVAFPQLKLISEIVGLPTQGEDKQFTDRLCSFAEALLLLLENNEECRLSWGNAGVKGQIENTNFANFKILLNEEKQLSLLIEECKYGVQCKSEFVDFINRRKKQIFDGKQRVLGLKVEKQMYLPSSPQNYDHLQLLSESAYFEQLQGVGQRLIMYKNISKDYMDNHLSFKELQQICTEIMRQDHSIFSGLRTNKLIKYILVFCQDQENKFIMLKKKIAHLNNRLVQSVIKNFYVGFQAKLAISSMKVKLGIIQQRLTKDLVQQRKNQLQKKKISNKNDEKSNLSQKQRNYLGVRQIENELMDIQGHFNQIYEYMTETKQTIFVRFFPRKQNKRAIQLLEIEDYFSHLYKLSSNFAYADQMIKCFQMRQYKNERKKYIGQKCKQLQQLTIQLELNDDAQFKYIFQQIQRLAIFMDYSLDDREWGPILIKIQNKLLNFYLSERLGHNKFKDYVQKIKSGQQVENSSLKGSRVFRQYVFEDSLSEIINKNSSLASSRVNKQEGLINKHQQYQQGLNYLDSLRPAFGQEFMDVVNFRVYILLKLTRKIEKCLENTPYSQQPLNLQLTRLLQNLRIIPLIIVTQINQQKLNLIFYPKINAGLFSYFRSTLKNHRQTIAKIQEQINNDPIKGSTIDERIKFFVRERLKFVHLLLLNSQKLENIAYTVEKVMKTRQNYGIERQESQEMLLKLLIAEKEMKADESALVDGMSKKLISYRAIQLLATFILPLMIRSLSYPFELDHNYTNANTLSDLLELCQKCKAIVAQSNVYLQMVLKLIQERGRNGINQLITDCKSTLQAFRSKLQVLLQSCQRFRGIDVKEVSKQLSRINEFLLICVNGRRISEEIIDERSRRFLKIVQSINS